MSKREEQHFNLIAALHDQLEDVETFERYRQAVEGHEEFVAIWSDLKSRAEDAVTMIRRQIREMVGS